MTKSPPSFESATLAKATWSIDSPFCKLKSARAAMSSFAALSSSSHLKGTTDSSQAKVGSSARAKTRSSAKELGIGLTLTSMPVAVTLSTIVSQRKPTMPSCS